MNHVVIAGEDYNNNNRKAWINIVSKIILVKTSEIKLLLCFGPHLFWREEYNGSKYVSMTCNQFYM